MASFLLLKGPADPAKVYAALLAAGLTPAKPNISIIILAAKPSGWGEPNTVPIRSVKDLEGVLSATAEMAVIAWGGGTIALSYDKCYFAVIDGELSDEIGGRFRGETVPEALYKGHAPQELAAAWYAGKVLVRTAFGDLLGSSVPEPVQRALVPRARTTSTVVPPLPPLPPLVLSPRDYVLRKQFAPLVARTNATIAIIDSEGRAVQVVSGVGTSIARGVCGKVNFLTPSIPAANALDVLARRQHFATSQSNVTSFNLLS